MNESDAVRYTSRMAFGFVLVASIRRRPRFQVARVISTVSATGGPVAGITVSVPVRLTPNAVAVTVTTVSAVTAEVVTGKFPDDCPPLTTTSLGTVTTAGLLLTSETRAPS